MSHVFSNVWGALRRPGRLALAAALLGLVGIILYAVGGMLWADAQIRAGRQALDRDDFVQARAHLLLSLRVYRNAPDVHFLLARAARRAGDFDAARTHLAECRRLGGVEEAVELERVLADIQRGRLDEAEKYRRFCLDQDHPESVWILEALAQGYVHTYRLPQAMLCLNRWLQLRPDNVRALLLRAEASEHLQYSVEARKDYQRVVELDPDNEAARFALADSLAQAERASEALAHFRLLRTRRPGDPAVLVGLARCLVDLGQNAEAHGLLQALLAEDPRELVGMIQLGKVALAEGKPDEARGWLEKAVKRVPYDREAVHNLAQCYQQLGRKADAEHCFEQIKTIAAEKKVLREVVQQMFVRPHDPLPRFLAGQIFWKAGNAVEALRWFESALQEDPGHLPTHEALRDYYRLAGRADLAALHEQKLRQK